MAHSDVFKVVSWPLASCTCAISWSSCSSWTMLCQNCVVTSIILLASCSMLSNLVAMSSMEAFLSATCFGNVVGYTRELRIRLVSWSWIIVCPNHLAFLTRVRSIVFSKMCWKASETSYSTSLHLAHICTYSMIRRSYNFFNSVISSAAFRCSSFCASFRALISWIFSSVSYTQTWCSSSACVCSFSAMIWD